MDVAMWWMGSGWDGIGCISHFHSFTFISARRNTLSGRQPSNLIFKSIHFHFNTFTFSVLLSISHFHFNIGETQHPLWQATFQFSNPFTFPFSGSLSQFYFQFHTFTFISARRNTLSGGQPSNLIFKSISRFSGFPPPPHTNMVWNIDSAD